MVGMLNGIVSRKKEDGKISTMLYIAQIPLSAYDSKADIALGFRTKEVFVGYNVDAKPGDTVEVIYDEGFAGKAVVSEIKVLERRNK